MPSLPALYFFGIPTGIPFCFTHLEAYACYCAAMIYALQAYSFIVATLQSMALSAATAGHRITYLVWASGNCPRPTGRARFPAGSESILQNKMRET